MVEASGGLEEIHARLCALRHALARLGSVRGAWDAVGQLWVRDVVHGACGERVARAARALALRRTGAAPILRMASPVRVATAHASLEPGSYFGLVACVPATRLAQSAPELALPPLAAVRGGRVSTTCAAVCTHLPAASAIRSRASQVYAWVLRTKPHTQVSHCCSRGHLSCSRRMADKHKSRAGLTGQAD